MLNLFGEVMNVSRLDSRQNDRLNPGQSIMALDGSATGSFISVALPSSAMIDW